MHIKPSTIVETNGNGKVTRSIRANFISIEGLNITAYSTPEKWLTFEMTNPQEVEILLNTFERTNKKSAYGAENVESYIDFCGMHKHDCKKCESLGAFDGVDLYKCGGSLIARYSSNESDCASMPIEMCAESSHKELKEAFERLT